jgi:hypothetical protein
VLVAGRMRARETTARALGAAELGAGLLTVAVHVAPLERYLPEAVEIVVVASAWTIHLVRRGRADRAFAARCGLIWTRDQLRLALFSGLLLLAIAMSAMALVATERGHELALPPTFFGELLIYPIWGLIQQWIMVAVVLDRARGRLSPALAVSLTAAIFSLTHAPDLDTMLATAIFGLAAYSMFIRARVLPVLAILHGGLGVLFYHWVKGTDPLGAALGLP